MNDWTEKGPGSAVRFSPLVISGEYERYAALLLLIGTEFQTPRDFRGI